MPALLAGSSARVAGILLTVKASVEANAMNPEPKHVFILGDMVRLKAGPFASFTGKIEGINQSKAMLKVAVDIFGRRTAVKVNFREAEKLQFEPPKPPQTSMN
jgi:transcriptional antiterminator NusG